MQCAYWHPDKNDRRNGSLLELRPKKLHQSEQISYDVHNPQNNIITSNPNHLLQFLQFFHLSLKLDEPLIKMDMESIEKLFWEY